MELLGKIKLIGDTKTYGDNGFRKRELVLTTEEQYPQHILIEFIQNNCELLENKLTNQGQEAIVVRLSTTFPIRFSSLSEQYFNQLIKENYNNRSLSKGFKGLGFLGAVIEGL